MDVESRHRLGGVRSRLLREARAMLDEGQPLHLRALASRAGITAGSMYHHYDSKAALLAELAAAGFAELRRDLEQGLSTAGEGRRLRGWATAYFHFARRERALFALMFDPEITAAPGVAAAREALIAGLRDVVRTVATAQNRPEAPVEQITLAVWAAAHGTAALAGSAPDRPELIEEVIVGLEGLFPAAR